MSWQHWLPVSPVPRRRPGRTLDRNYRPGAERLEDRVTPAGPTPFTGIGAANVTAAIQLFQQAIGGSNNGAGPAQSGGFRTINWDAVALDGTDFGGDTTVIVPNSTVGIPVDRFQARGVRFDEVYAVSGDGFTSVNAGVTNQFPAFSPNNTFAPFNETHTIELSFVAPGTTTPRAVRGFGAVFLDVESLNTTSIEYFNGTTSLGKYFVPSGPTGQPEFLGQLYEQPVVTSVRLSLGTGRLFSFDGQTVTSGPADITVNQNSRTDQVATDDFIFSEPTSPPPPVLVAAADAGGGPSVSVIDPVTKALKFSFFAYDPAFTGGLRVAMGDVNRDGTPDIITGPGPGGGPNIRVFDGTTGQIIDKPIGNFLAYGAEFAGGVYVASGDVNGDGAADVIVGADAGGGPNVSVFSGLDGKLVTSFFPYDQRFTGGVRVAAGDVNGDGRADIICGTGVGGGPNVTVISGADGRTLLASFFAYGQDFTAGIYVAAGDFDGDGKADVITGAGAGGGPNISVFGGGNFTLLTSFFPYDPRFTGGVRVSSLNLGVGAGFELVSAPGPGGGPDVGLFNGTTGAAIDHFFIFDPRFTGGLFVAGNP